MVATTDYRTVQSLGHGAACQNLLIPHRESLENDHNTRNGEFMLTISQSWLIVSVSLLTFLLLFPADYCNSWTQGNFSVLHD